MIPDRDEIRSKLCDYATQSIGYLITHGGEHIRDIGRGFQVTK